MFGQLPLAAAMLALSFAEGPAYNGFNMAAVRGKLPNPKQGMAHLWWCCSKRDGGGVVENEGKSLLAGPGVGRIADTSPISISPSFEYLIPASPSPWPLLLPHVETNDPNNYPELQSLGDRFAGPAPNNHG